MKIYIACFFLLIVFISSCNEVERTQLSEFQEMINNGEIPEHLQGLENLKIWSPDSKPSFSLRFIEHGYFGSSTEVHVTVSGNGAIGVDNEGRVFIADRESFSVHAFQSDGGYITSIGRRGRGPGEFLSMGNLKIDSKNIYVYDSLQLRIIIFSLESLSHTQSVDLNPQNWRHIEELRTKGPTDYYPVNGGNFLIKFANSILEIESSKGENNSFSYYLVNQRGEIISDLILNQEGRPHEFISFQNNRFSVTLPYMGEPLIELSHEGSIFSANSHLFFIKKYSPGGDYSEAFFLSLRKNHFAQRGFN
ncbi:6-bladed beta-propeller [Rhodohalobacter sp. SW132]|uniref:BF3164 family lipoprotein n=1 Tax=Rhodohalobacter sp. SW132 TaxID=2293433 RepID=UPI000E26F06F|nr:BF3164 family lipoprotein [Rhodohalobacter sp. SW132]REL37780.1 6-bladed beta-propeller [Rhodohalobacter sp. SW132]